jgi:hypothetical protein
VPVKVYDLTEIPSRRARAADAELRPYLDALKNGRGAGDGTGYATREEASRACMRLVNRARRMAREQDLPYPGQRVWQDRSGKWFWALVPSQRRGGDERPRRTRRTATPVAS